MDVRRCLSRATTASGVAGDLKKQAGRGDQNSIEMEPSWWSCCVTSVKKLGQGLSLDDGMVEQRPWKPGLT